MLEGGQLLHGPSIGGEQGALQLGAPLLLRRGEREPPGGAQQRQQLMHAAHGAERVEHGASGLGVIAPGAPGEELLGDALPGAEAVVVDAPDEAAGLQLVVDAAAVGRGQVRARRPGGLVKGKKSGLIEGEPDAAEGRTARAVGVQRGFIQGLLLRGLRRGTLTLQNTHESRLPPGLFSPQATWS